MACRQQLLYVGDFNIESYESSHWVREKTFSWLDFHSIDVARVMTPAGDGGTSSISSFGWYSQSCGFTENCPAWVLTAWILYLDQGNFSVSFLVAIEIQSLLEVLNDIEFCWVGKLEGGDAMSWKLLQIAWLLLNEASGLINYPIGVWKSRLKTLLNLYCS